MEECKGLGLEGIVWVLSAGPLTAELLSLLRAFEMYLAALVIVSKRIMLASGHMDCISVTMLCLLGVVAGEEMGASMYAWSMCWERTVVRAVRCFFFFFCSRCIGGLRLGSPDFEFPDCVVEDVSFLAECV